MTLSRDDINRAYKRLAMLLHPDKTELVGAEEAFKALNNAKNALLPSGC
jgi:DnaJ family protein C protein 27